MNSFFWILQTLLAMHTVMGAVWKFSNSTQSIPALQVIPHGIWLALSVFELIVALCLILPAFNKRLAIVAPIAAACIAAEMLLLCAVNVLSAESNNGQMIYWLVVAAICAFLVYGRLVLKPLNARANKMSG